MRISDWSSDVSSSDLCCLQQRRHDQQSRDRLRADRFPERFDTLHILVGNYPNRDTAEQRLKQLVDRMGRRHVRLLAEHFVIRVRMVVSRPYQEVEERAMTASDQLRHIGGARQQNHKSK